MALFAHLLLPVLWERLANIPPLVRLLQAYVDKAGRHIEPERISGMLGIFQKLIASKTNDHQGFYLLNTMVEKMPESVMEPYLKQIFVLLFQRLSSSKTTKYIKSLLTFFSLFAVKYSPARLVSTIDAIQPKLFGMVLEKLVVPDLNKVSGNLERKICAVGFSRVLTEAPDMLNNYSSLWTGVLGALIGLFELPTDESVPDDEHFVDVEDAPQYQAAFSQLMFAGKVYTTPHYFKCLCL